MEMFLYYHKSNMLNLDNQLAGLKIITNYIVELFKLNKFLLMQGINLAKIKENL